jgi:selenide,water dikinase
MDSNREHFGSGVKVGAGVDDDMMDLLYDPQTSGGLLAFIAADYAAAALHALREKRVPAEEVGIAIEPTGNWIEVG